MADVARLSKDELQRILRAHDSAIAQLDDELATVENGTHPQYRKQVRRLQRAKKEREKMARHWYEAELVTLDRLHELEIVAASKQLERGMERAREKIMDQIAAKAKIAEARREGSADDSSRMNTRSLRSKASGLNEDGERTTGRRTTTRRGAQSPASMLLEKTLSDAAMDADFQSIANLQNGGRKRSHDNMS
ncbi:hypothetical protein CTAYLR_009831 [Chrysophaeum taylorii]|uniref:Uncharacterized protein n=1 Tax=Chrysophaeum taylorii TaxID=2483200 RepID=A0AAD7UC92_9STRA|nr:hypothetical protein CTAYLR_009831 [Chrysophaeum taylorii]